jgi:glyoxylase-like metal-dependent hydrolase (beta-lactamase superfamily II)
MTEKKAAIEMLTAGPLMTNYFVVGCLETGEGAVIDAGFAGERIVQMADDAGVTVTQILQTHAHIDHVAALTDVKERTEAPIYLHPDDQTLYDSAPEQGKFFGYDIDPLPPVDEHLADEDEITVGNLRATVLLLPGHSPGSVAFWFEELGVVFGGDVLFAGSIGRVDLPGSSPDAMRKSLDRMTSLLPDDTRVLPGHGPETTIGMEKKRNPFLLQEW